MEDRVIFHADVNSAFLSWSAAYALQHASPIDFREIPSIVGGNQASRYGITLSRSIPAKQYGVTVGEAVAISKQKCPNLLVIPPNYWLYMKCSSAMMEILKDYSDRIQVFSIDEAFLDFTGMQQVLGDPVDVANKIKDRIYKELNFSISIGISSNKLLAKMASELKKPNAVSTLFPWEIKNKMWPLPIRELYMCGEKTEKKLQGMGIYTIGDLANTDIEFVRYKLKSWGDMLYSFAHGIEDTPVKPGGSLPYIKGVGNSCTIHFDVEDVDTAHKVLLSLVETVGMRLRHGSFCCRLVQVTIKTNKLISYSHQHKFSIPTDCTNAIYEESCKLFDAMWKGEPIRHLGVRTSDLCGNDFIQLSFLDDSREKERLIDRAIDEIRMKFGATSVFRAGFLHSRLSPLQGGVVEDFPIMTSML